MKLVKKIMTTANKYCLSFIAALALLVTYSGVNSACWYVMNQDELPKNSKKLRKF
uniref:cyclic lactone autoinducer peptide n=1 Tax=Agathobacter sp. TaxID=2021311 RepID=UPI00405738CF